MPSFLVDCLQSVNKCCCFSPYELYLLNDDTVYSIECCKLVVLFLEHLLLMTC